MFGLYAQYMSKLDKNNFVKIPHNSPEHLEVIEKIKITLRGLKITYEVSRVGNSTIIEILP